MTAVRIRRPEAEETALSDEEMLLALREGFLPVGEADAMIIVTPKLQPVLRIEVGRRRAPAWSATDGAELRGAA